jgi:hypothetical protein
VADVSHMDFELLFRKNEEDYNQDNRNITKRAGKEKPDLFAGSVIQDVSKPFEIADVHDFCSCESGALLCC